MAQDAYSKFDAATNTFGDWKPVFTNRERVSYDANGNIQTLDRHSISPDPNTMDSLIYHYYAGTNRLRRVKDTIPDWKFGNNLDVDNQPDSNYVYDSIGNLMADKAEKITNIKWNVYGKITEITSNASITDDNTTFWTRYTYDAQGNRIGKNWRWYDKNSSKYVLDYVWYVRDAQGNLLSTYASTVNEDQFKSLDSLTIRQVDVQLYGSSRLGVFTPENIVDNVGNTGPALNVGYAGAIHYRGSRQYELTNHLGNVLTTTSDRKIGVYSGSSLPNSTIRAVSYYEAEKLAGFDYYPFGMMSRSTGYATRYRFGFNGKENDNEVKGGLGNQQDYGMRIYDPRLGRFLSVDPLTKSYPWYTPYQFAGNKPILYVDVDGLEEGTPSTYVRPTNMPAALPTPSFKGIINIADARSQEVHQMFQGNFLELKKERNSQGAIQMVNGIVGERWNGSVLKIQLVGQHQQVQKNWERTSIVFMNEYTYSLEYTNEDGDVTTESGSLNYPVTGVNFTSVYEIAASLVVSKVWTKIVNGPSLTKGITFTQREMRQESAMLSRLLRWVEVKGNDYTKAAMETSDFTRRLGRKAIQELKELGFTKETFEKWRDTYKKIIETYEKTRGSKDTQVPKSRLESVEKILKLWDGK